jgi:hypothetical protein
VVLIAGNVLRFTSLKSISPLELSHPWGFAPTREFLNPKPSEPFSAAQEKQPAKHWKGHTQKQQQRPAQLAFPTFLARRLRKLKSP